MNQRIPLLAGLLVGQLALIGLISLGIGGGPSAQPFLDLPAASVTAIRISDGEGSEVSLSRVGESWRLDDLPADGAKVAEVLEELLAGAASWPVATTSASQARFEVTADGYQRRLTFSGADEELAEVYLGTSPGFRRVHARAAASDAIYSIDFAVHQVPVARDDWLDKSLLNTTGLTSVTLEGGWELAQDEVGEWLVDGQPADSEAARRLVERLEGLSVLGLFEGDEAALGDASKVTLEGFEGPHVLTLRHNDADDEYVVTSDRYGERFTVASYIAEQILVPAQDLLPEAADLSDSPAGGGAPAGASVMPAATPRDASDALEADG